MSHELSIRADGFAEMAYRKSTGLPWHSLGQAVPDNASIEEWQKAAGMDWKVVRSRVRYGEGKNQLTWDDRVVLFRSDTKKPLSVVSKGFQPVQPAWMLEFFRDLVGENGFELDTAGVLFEGRKMWAQAIAGEQAAIAGDEDVVRSRLLLATACDGFMATNARFVAERVVCFNTLSIALNEKAKHVVKIHHNTKADAARIKDELGIARGQFREFVKNARALTKKRVNDQGASDFIAKVLVETKTVTAKEEVEKAVLASTPYKKLMELFKGEGQGATLKGCEGTAWGLVNSFTEFVDHHSAAATASNRMDRAWFGAGDRLKTAALGAAIAL